MIKRAHILNEVGQARRAVTKTPLPRVPPPSRIQLLARGVNTCGTPEAMRHWLQGFAKALNFYGGRYVHLGHGLGDAQGVVNRGGRFLSTAARDFDGAQGVSACSVDPVAPAARAAFLPFRWSTQADDSLTEGQQAWIRAERSRGIGAGVAIPIQDYAAGPAYLSLFGVDEATADTLVEGWSSDLMFVGVLFHAQAKDVLPSIGDPRSALTPREIQCLRLAAMGCTVPVTAEELGVAPRTVEFHLANAAAKMGALNKIHAVAKAASAGLVQV